MPFMSCIMAFCQDKSLCKTILTKIYFICISIFMQITFFYIQETFCSRTRFETEVIVTWKRPTCIVIVEFILMYWKLHLHGELLNEWAFQKLEKVHGKVLDSTPLMLMASQCMHLQIDLQAENICKRYCFQ